MNLDGILVGAILAGALIFLLCLFGSKQSNGCGCGSVDCKVPKPEIKKPSTKRNQQPED